MSSEYPNYDGTEPKIDVQEIYDAYHNGAKNPLHFIETLCYHLDLPVDDVTIDLLGDHVYTPDYENNFFGKNPCGEDLKFEQMTDYKGFRKLLEYAQKRKKCLKKLHQDLAEQMKGEANEND